MSDYTLPAWEAKYHVRAARQAMHRAIRWKREAKECLRRRDLDGHNQHMAHYLQERNYARGIMLVLTSVREHKTPGEKRAERNLADKMRREYVV